MAWCVSMMPSPRSKTNPASAQAAPSFNRRSACRSRCRRSALTAGAASRTRRFRPPFGTPTVGRPSSSRVTVRRTAMAPRSRSTSSQRSARNSPRRIAVSRVASHNPAKSSLAVPSRKARASAAVQVVSSGGRTRGGSTASQTLRRTSLQRTAWVSACRRTACMTWTVARLRPSASARAYRPWTPASSSRVSGVAPRWGVSQSRITWR